MKKEMLSARHFLDIEYNRKSKMQGKAYPIPDIGTIVELTEVRYTTRGGLKLEHPLGTVCIESYTGCLVICQQVYKNGSYMVTYKKDDFRKGLITFNVVDKKEDYSQRAAV